VIEIIAACKFAKGNAAKQKDSAGSGCSEAESAPAQRAPVRRPELQSFQSHIRVDLSRIGGLQRTVQQAFVIGR
jgi:hypothetical protein